MNLAQAVAVCLYELTREASATASIQAPKAASSGEIARITALMFQALTASGYVKPRTAASTEEKLRRLVRRMQLPAEDAEVWMGMLRKIVWKLQQR